MICCTLYMCTTCTLVLGKLICHFCWIKFYQAQLCSEIFGEAIFANAVKVTLSSMYGRIQDKIFT